METSVHENKLKEIDGSSPIVKKKKNGDRVKRRGPPRPHRKLEDAVLRGRIDKLRKRIVRASNQLEDARRHVSVYEREAAYRVEDTSTDKKDHSNVDGPI